MPWSGPYYYRSVRVNGKPRRQYVGSGRLAELCEEADTLAREKRERRKAQVVAALPTADALDADLEAVSRLAEMLARAALVAAGCHQHKRGEWRRKRERS